MTIQDNPHKQFVFPRKQLIRKRPVLKKLQIASATLDAMMDKNSPYYNPRFPKKFTMGGRAVFWVEEDIDRFIDECRTSSTTPKLE